MTGNGADTAVRSVALIGVGAMGRPMAQRIIAAGYEVTVFDRSAEALRPFEGEVAKIASAPSDCASCDAVLIVVATGDQVREVIFGPDGVLAGRTSTAQTPLVVVMSTIGRGAIESVKSDLAGWGVTLIEAPISGGAARAAAGTLSVLTGGAPDDIAPARPLLEHVGSKVFYCGQIGSAQVIKIANNVLGNLNTIATAEVFRVLGQAGVTIADAASVFEASSGRNWLSADPEGAMRAYAALTEVPFETTASIIRKDTGLAMELSAEVEGSYPMLSALNSVVGGLGEETFETWRWVSGSSD